MPLVSKSIIERWYQRDSWVYKNFAYLFHNPLWEKNVPGGFSLCPYFWLSLFSLVVVRPFVLAILGFRTLVELIGLTALIERTDKLICRTKPPVFGIPTFLALLAAGLLGLLCLGIGVGGAKLVSVILYYEIGTPVALILGLLAVCLPCWIYRCAVDGPCKVENYTRGATFLTLVLAIVLMPHQFAWAILGLLSGLFLVLQSVWWLITVCAGGIWYFIAHFPGWCVDGIGAAISWVASGILWLLAIIVGFFVTFALTLVIVVASLALLTLLGFFTTKVYATSEYKAAKDNEAERWRKYQVALGGLAHRLWEHDSHPWKIKEWETWLQYGWDPYITQALWKSVDRDQQIPKKVEEKIKDRAIALRNKQLEEREIAKQRRTEKCQKVSSAVGSVVSPIYAVICSMFVACWNGFVWCVKILCKGIMEVATFIALLWKLFWAWKQGACPYFRFTDTNQPPQQPAPTTTTPQFTGCDCGECHE